MYNVNYCELATFTMLLQRYGEIYNCYLSTFQLQENYNIHHNLSTATI